MLHHFRLDLIDRLARNFKGVDAPFGGLQVIFCGDFFQLPPVSRGGEPEASFAYESKVWQDLDLKICYLEEQWRQKDQAYLKLLNAIRSGEMETEAVELLQSRFGQIFDSIDPTRLYTHNADVDLENERELAKIDEELIELPMTATGRENLSAILKKGCLAPENLRLKKGAKVMFVKNNFEVGYVNGTLGVVEECDNFGIKVRIRSGKLIKAETASWAIEEDGKIKAQITQYPLRLAWAITVHKSQGMSLDAAEVDLSQSFERGMGYVALSRVRSLNGLVLRGLNDMAPRVNEEVLERDGEFRLMSKKVVVELKQMSADQKVKMEREFLQRVGADKDKKEKKPDTISETKKLAEAGWPVAKIAKERGLKPETIITHLEEIKLREPDFDFSVIKKGILASRLKKIQMALRAGGVEEGGGYLLTPAKIKLGSGYSYEEIRLGRLLM
jgi:ATP-dependent exoDNAse (exonuclease V) alpha subunit